MRTRHTGVLVLVAVVAAAAGHARADLGTAFVYQGQLLHESKPVSGTADLEFSLWDAPTGGTQIGSTLTLLDHPVTGGLFSVELNFGSGVFPGSARFLELAVRYPAGSGDFVTLDPRQKLTLAPYAVRADSAGLAESATHADDADHADLADTATHAAQATQADTASFADTAAQADEATHADSADVADVAQGLDLPFTGDASAGEAILSIANTSTSASGAHGGYFRTDSSKGKGVYGYASAASGATHGGYFVSDSSGGKGVEAKGGERGIQASATAASGSTYGGYFGAGSPDGLGVFATGGKTGVMGAVFNTTGTDYGGYFQSDSSGGYALYAHNRASSGTPRAGYFLCEAQDGYAGYFNNTYPGARAGYFHGTVKITASGSSPTLEVTNSSGAYAAEFTGNVRIRSGATGDEVILLGDGLDYAEGFDLAAGGEASPGAVLVIDPDHAGRLTLSRTAYDRKVAGVVAGAGGLGSGVRLGADSFDCDVALAGRVYCNVDATNAAVEPGDLLTTSPTPGHAMKVVDHQAAQGAILGKAMEGLPAGTRGQILILVTLQ